MAQRLQEKSMAKDVKDAIDNHESVVLKLAGLTNLCREVQKERNLFINGLDKLRDEIKDFENIINEQKVVYDKNLLQTKKEVTKSLSNMDNTINEMSLDRMQLKAMVKNQNFHFTEIQKNLGVTIYRTEKLERIAATIPGIQMQIQKTDNYLNFYQPMEITAQIHTALQAALQTAPTKLKLDAIQHSNKRVKEIIERIHQIGTEKEQPFVKEDYMILKLDMDSFLIQQQWEEEERQRIDREKAEALDRLHAKTPAQIFDDHLYEPNQIDKLSLRLLGVLDLTVRKIVKGEVDTNANIVKLVQFYNDEFGDSQKGSDSSTHSDQDSDSSYSSSSSSNSSSNSSNSQSSEQSQDSVNQSEKSQNVKTSKSLHKRSLSHIESKKEKSDQMLIYSSEADSSSKYSDDTLKLRKSRPKKARRSPSSIEEKSSEESPQPKNKKRKVIDDSQSAQSESTTKKLRKPKKAKKAKLDEESDIQSIQERPYRKKSKKISLPDPSSENELEQALDKKSKTKHIIKDDEKNQDSLQVKESKKSKSRSKKSSIKVSSQETSKEKNSKENKKSRKKSKESINSKQKSSKGQIVDKSRDQDKEDKKQNKDKKDKKRKKDKKDRSKQEIINEVSSRHDLPNFDQLLAEKTIDSNNRKHKHNKSKKDKKGAKNQKQKQYVQQIKTFDAVRREDGKDVKNTTFYSGAPSSGAGSRINQIRGTKALFQKLQDQIDLCVTRAEFDKTNSDVPRLLAEVGIYRQKLNIYERNFDETTTHNLVQENIKKIENKIEFQFKDYKETKSRIQRINESQIIELKNLMIELAKQIHELNRKQMESDAEKLKINHNRLPRDILYLSKDEITLRRELAISLEDTEDMKESLNKDLKRLRREHYSNLKDLEQIIQKFDQSAAQLKSVVERQGLNDQAMAAIFKVMKLDHSLLHQDELDRASIHLMGMTDPKGKLEEQGKHSIRVQTPSTANQKSQMTPIKGSVTQGSRDSDTEQNQILQITTREQIQESSKVKNKNKQAKVIAINRTCMTHADGVHNELVVKAFKMACLNYEPSEVEFENNMYQRSDLIKAKGDLLQYCLSQLKHLDLSLIDQKLHLQSLNSKVVQYKKIDVDLSMFDPKDFPPVPSTTNQTSREYQLDWLNQDSVESLQQIAQKYKERNGYHQKNLSMTTRDVRQSLNLPISGSIQITKRDIGQNYSPNGGGYMNARQLNSVFKANRNHQLRQTEVGIQAFKTTNNKNERKGHQDSLTMSQLDELSVDGNNCVQLDAQRTGLYTAGTPHNPQHININLQKRSQMRTSGKQNIGNIQKNDSGAFLAAKDTVRGFHRGKLSGQITDQKNQILLSMSNTPGATQIMSPKGIYKQSPQIVEQALPKLKTNKAINRNAQSLQSQKSTIIQSNTTDDHTTKKEKTSNKTKRQVQIHQNLSISVESSNQLIQESKNE